MTTIQITTSSILDVADALGDHAADYDIDAIISDYQDAINAALPGSVYLARNGDVYADVEDAEMAREIDWKAIEESLTGTFWEIATRHDHSA